MKNLHDYCTRGILAGPARAFGALAAAALLAAGCGQGAGADAPPPPDYETELAGAPAELAGLHAEADELLAGGTDAYERRLAELEGFPVVVNKWASWCGPCRAEFPHFQNQAAKLGREVAFLGVNANDNDDAAATFLERFPVPYPSYRDPDSEISELIGAGREFPATAFYDAGGERVHVKLGAYASEEDLAADIESYAR